MEIILWLNKIHNETLEKTMNSFKQEKLKVEELKLKISVDKDFYYQKRNEAKKILSF